MEIIHSGFVTFRDGAYSTDTASAVTVAPIFGFRPLAPPQGINPPLGQVEVKFDQPLTKPYAILVTACRSESTPALTANYGDVTADGFVVHLWETCTDRTVQNGGFSFLVCA